MESAQGHASGSSTSSAPGPSTSENANSPRGMTNVSHRAARHNPAVTEGSFNLDASFTTSHVGTAIQDVKLATQKRPNIPSHNEALSIVHKNQAFIQTRMRCISCSCNSVTMFTCFHSTFNGCGNGLCLACAEESDDRILKLSGNDLEEWKCRECESRQGNFGGRLEDSYLAEGLVERGKTFDVSSGTGVDWNALGEKQAVKPNSVRQIVMGQGIEDAVGVQSGMSNVPVDVHERAPPASLSSGFGHGEEIANQHEGKEGFCQDVYAFLGESDVLRREIAMEEPNEPISNAQNEVQSDKVPRNDDIPSEPFRGPVPLKHQQVAKNSDDIASLAVLLLSENKSSAFVDDEDETPTQ